jgi:methionine synthase II (cobalamin-independent)
MGLSNLKTDNKSQYARIKVDINNKLDEEFQINFMKNFAIIPSAIKDDFISIAKKARTESLNNLNYIKRKKQIGRKRTDDFVYIWLVENTKDGQKLTINLDHPIIKEFTNEFGLKRIKKLVNVLSKTIPVSQIRQGGFSINEQLSDSEFKEIFDKIFEKYKKQGLNNQQIYSALSNIEPFSNNKEKLYELIGEISDGQ